MQRKLQIITGNARTVPAERRLSLSAVGRELITLVRHPVRYNAVIRGAGALQKMFPSIAEVPQLQIERQVPVETVTHQQPSVTVPETQSSAVHEAAAVSLDAYRHDEESNLGSGDEHGRESVHAARQRLDQIWQKELGDAQEAA